MSLAELQCLVQSVNDRGFTVHWNWDTGDIRLTAKNHNTGSVLVADPPTGADAFRNLAEQAANASAASD